MFNRLNPLRLFRQSALPPELELAQRLMESGQHAQAMLAYHKALAEFPGHPVALRGVSTLLMRRGGRENLRKALTTLQEAIRKDPLEPANYHLTTLCYSRLGMPKLAAIERKKMAVSRTLHRFPGNATANNYMGVMLLQLQQHDLAVGFFQKAVAANPEYDLALRNLAKTHYLLASRDSDGAANSPHLQAARMEIAQALAIKRTAASLATQARIRLALDDLPGAEEDLEAARTLDPQRGEIREMQAALEIRQRRVSDGLAAAAR